MVVSDVNEKESIKEMKNRKLERDCRISRKLQGQKKCCRMLQNAAELSYGLRVLLGVFFSTPNCLHCAEKPTTILLLDVSLNSPISLQSTSQSHL